MQLIFSENECIKKTHKFQVPRRTENLSRSKILEVIGERGRAILPVAFDSVRRPVAATAIATNGDAMYVALNIMILGSSFCSFSTTLLLVKHNMKHDNNMIRRSTSTKSELGEQLFTVLRTANCYEYSEGSIVRSST